MAAGGDDFGHREDIELLFGAQHTAVELASLDEFFDQHLAVFGEGLTDGRHQLFGAFDLGGGHTAATRGGFDKEGKSELLKQGIGVDGLVAVEELGLGQADHSKTAHYWVTKALVESEGRGVEATGGVGNAQHVQIALKHTVLAGIAVDDNEGKVETRNPLNGEVVAVDGAVLAIVGEPVPSCALNDYLIDIILLVVQVFVNLTATANRDIVFSGKAAHHEGDIFLVHIC